MRLHALDDRLRFLVQLGVDGMTQQVRGEQRVQCAPPRLGSRVAHTRVMYSPVRVSTLIFVPGSMKSGTCTVAPLSSVAGFVAPETRSPFTPGSVCATT